MKEDYLDEEFDPDAHDALMENMFGQDYYQEDDEDLLKTLRQEKEENQGKLIILLRNYCGYL